MMERYGRNEIGKFELHNPDFEAYLSARGFRIVDMCQWVIGLFGAHDKGLSGYWYDHKRRFRNNYYDVYVFSPYATIDELQKWVENSDIVVNEFSSRGYDCLVIPNIYVERAQMIRNDGKIYGSILFIKQYRGRND